MRLVRFEDPEDPNLFRAGVLDGTEVIEVSDGHHVMSADPLWDLITSAPAGDITISDVAARWPIASVHVRAPIARPPKIIAAPVNYLDHKAEMQVEHTVADLGIFLKAPTSVIGPGEDVLLPYTDKRFDQEAELGVIIGQRARNIRVESALDIVFGYTCVLDMSMRSTEDRSTRKSFDTFTPMGPVILTKDEVEDPATLQLWCQVNGVERQSARVADLIFDVPTLISYASSVMTLEPGDVIATGTPAGVGPVVAGDVIEMGIDVVGSLKVSVSAADAVPYEERVGSDLDAAHLRSRGEDPSEG